MNFETFCFRRIEEFLHEKPDFFDAAGFWEAQTDVEKIFLHNSVMNWVKEGLIVVLHEVRVLIPCSGSSCFT
jgi:hypothetical protein